MENEKLENCSGEAFAERCKKALENDLGFVVPMPRFKSQKKDRERQIVAKNVELIQEENQSPQDRSIETISSSQEFDEKTLEALNKITNEKRLTNDEFQMLYEVIWKKGPESKVKNPDNWFRRTVF